MTLARRPQLPAPTLFAAPAQARRAPSTLRIASRDGVASTDLRRDSRPAGIALARRCAGTPVGRASGDAPVERHSHSQRRNLQVRADKAQHFSQASRQ